MVVHRAVRIDRHRPPDQRDPCLRIILFGCDQAEQMKAVCVVRVAAQDELVQRRRFGELAGLVKSHCLGAGGIIHGSPRLRGSRRLAAAIAPVTDRRR